MQKVILIFGAGDNQLTLIRAANELGVRSVVIDPNDSAKGKELADVFEVVASNDYEKTREIALKYKVDGIVTSQMENPLRLMARLAAEQNYIFPAPEVIERCRNKFLMKQIFLEHQIPCAKGILFNKNEAITPTRLEGFRFPLIIKPADAHSSRGVYRVDKFEEILKYEKESRGFSSDQSLIIEEFIEGPEYSIEAITYHGETSVIQYTEKIITPYPRTVELGHIQPADLTIGQKKEINKIVSNAIKALGITDSASHTELKITDRRPVIIEIGARLGGDYISSYLTLASTDVNMDKASVQIALGISPEIKCKMKGFSYIKYLELPSGRNVRHIGNWQEYLKENDVVYGNISIKAGDTIAPVTDSAKRHGFIIVEGITKEDVIKKAEIAIHSFTRYITLN